MRLLWKILTLFGLCIVLTVVAASAADFTLSIYGNANLDNTIDEQDVAYVQGAINGIKPATSLADANNDGTIDEKDVTQIEHIINGTENKLTIKDKDGKAIGINEPVRRMVFWGATVDDPDTITALGAGDRVVGVGEELKTGYSVLFPKFSKLPSIGMRGSPDYETIIGLHPDIFLIVTASGKVEEDKLPGVTVITLPPLGVNSTEFKDTVTKLGYILDARD